MLAATSKDQESGRGSAPLSQSNEGAIRKELSCGDLSIDCLDPPHGSDMGHPSCNNLKAEGMTSNPATMASARYPPSNMSTNASIKLPYVFFTTIPCNPIQFVGDITIY